MLFIKFNILVSKFMSMENNIYLVPKKRKKNDIKQKGATHTFLIVGTYSGKYKCTTNFDLFSVSEMKCFPLLILQL